MIKYIIPDSEEVRPLNVFLIDFLKKHPNAKKKNTSIYAVYGTPGLTAWIGGRYLVEKQFSYIRTSEDLIKFYNSNSIRYHFVFSNMLLKEEHLNDVWGNALCKIGNNLGSGAIVASDLLVDYIREKYPRIKIVSSITKGLYNKEQQLDLIKNDKYDIVVPNTHFNDNIHEFVPEEFRGKCEILINDCCPPNCPNHIKCYSYNSMSSLCIDYPIGADECKNPVRLKHIEKDGATETPYSAYEWMKSFCDMKNFEYVKEKAEQGFQYFKINGRNVPADLMTMYYADYIINDEYRERFILDAIQDIFKNKLRQMVSETKIVVA